MKKKIEKLIIANRKLVSKNKEQQSLLASIVNLSDDAILSKNLNGIITSWNRGAKRVFGYTAEEIIGKPISILIPEHLRKEEKGIIKKIRRGKHIERYETTRIKKDGKAIDVSLTISPIKDSSGKIIGASKIARDITERKKAEEALIKANRLYSFISQINQSIVHINDEQELFDTACKIAVDTGQYKLAWIGLLDDQGLLNTVSTKAKPALVKVMRQFSGLNYSTPPLNKTPTGRLLRTGKYVTTSNIQFNSALQTLKKILVQHNINSIASFPLKKFGKIVGAFGFLSSSQGFFDDKEVKLLEEAAGDISFAMENFEKEKRRKQAEEERERIIQDAIQRNRDLEQFAYIVSHNLRAPVANIKGLSDLLEDESLPANERPDLIKNLSASVKKLDHVIMDLNHILQLKRGSNETKELVNLSELLSDITESVHGLIQKENVKIVARFDEVTEIMTLKSYLYSIFYNLITNSIKYKKEAEPPIIQMESFKRKNKIELIVKDNGSGIDLDKKGDQVFGLYKRFHLHIEGKGMGLFMVKTQVEALGGRISIRSQVNKGTEFKIEFENNN